MKSSHQESYGELVELTRRIEEKGLLKPQLGYYGFNILATFALLVAGVAILITAEGFWIRLVDALFLALIFGRLSFLGHDAGHKQIFASNRMNDIFGLLISFKLGMIRTWWVIKHNLHHGNPNQLGFDPDIDIPVVAFTLKDALTRRGVLRHVVKRQAWYIPVMLPFVCVTLRLAGVQYWRREKSLKYSLLEPFLMGLHFVIYFSFLFWFLGWHALWFMAVHQLAFGFYMGSVFATNHKGMPILESDSKMDYLRQQILTSRNVKGNAVIDFFMGGLNYQIEHHLFPQMARNKLKEAQVIVKAYCAELVIDYHEVSFGRSYVEILQSFDRISAAVRRPVITS